MRTDTVSSMMNKCRECGKTLSDDEIAFHKKIFNRGATEFFCLDCCGEYLNVSKDILEEKLQMYKKTGCTLFKENQDKINL